MINVTFTLSSPTAALSNSHKSKMTLSINISANKNPHAATRHRVPQQIAQTTEQTFACRPASQRNAVGSGTHDQQISQSRTTNDQLLLVDRRRWMAAGGNQPAHSPIKLPYLLCHKK